MVDFNTAYRVRLPAVVRCMIMSGREKMNEVSELELKLELELELSWSWS